MKPQDDSAEWPRRSIPSARARPGDRSQRGFALSSRLRRRHLKARDRAAGVTLQLLDAVAARNGGGIVTPACGAFDQLEHSVEFWSATARQTPVRVSATEVCLANDDFTVTGAGQWTATCGTTRRNEVLTFCAHDCSHPTASEHDQLEIPSVEPSESGAWQLVVPAFRARVAPL